MLRAHVADFILTDRRTPRRINLRALLWLALTWVDQRLCGFRGHVMVRHFEARTLRLRCLVCGAHTRGWTLDGQPPH